MSKYPIVVQGRVSYEIYWDGCQIRSEVCIPQELAEKFMALMEELERFSL